MLLKEIANQNTGTYAGVRFDNDTVAALRQYIEDNNIPNPVDDFHTTLLYSRKQLPKYQPIQYDAPYKGTPTKAGRLGENGTAVVVMFDSPELSSRHEELMGEHGATYDYDEYIPHVTLSYDAPDLDVDGLTKPDFPINMTKEYSEQLNL